VYDSQRGQEILFFPAASRLNPGPTSYPVGTGGKADPSPPCSVQVKNGGAIPPVTSNLTPRSWALLEKPPFAQLLKNFLIFYGTRRLNIVYTTSFHWSYAKPDQSSPYHPIIFKIHLNIILPPSLPSALFRFGFPTEILYAFLFTPCVLQAPSISSSLT
jgi:hypothetical protein